MAQKCKDIENMLESGSSVLVQYSSFVWGDKKTYEMYVTKINPNKSLTGFVKGSIAKTSYKDTNSLLNFFQGRGALKDQEFSEDWLIHTEIPDVVIDAKKENCPYHYDETEFVKIRSDKFVNYGDGGSAFLLYPLYFAKHLDIPSNNQQILVSKLNELGAKLNDWHDECPVLDIIDPDLSPNYYFRPKSKNERNKYAWFPVDVLVSANDKIKLLGPIHNLPPHENQTLYNCIFGVFQKMLPGFRKLGITEEGKESQIQVVVKAQKYVIQPGTSYSGKWHVEGKTEKIAAGGVYYCKIDSGFETDSVVYRPRIGPNPGFAEMTGIVMDAELEVQEGSAIVFSNILPHKFLKLTNDTDKALERLFINFFIVDPGKQLDSTTLYWEAEKALKKISKLSKFLIDEILSYLVYRPYLFEAKRRRRIARDCLKTEKSGWGFIHYGNSGDVEFFDSNTHQKRIKHFDTSIGSECDKIKEY